MPLKAGNTETLSIQGHLLHQITGGTYQLVLSLDGLPLVEHSDSICSLFGGSFPVPAGDFSISKQLTIPAYAPAGDYTAQLKFIDEANTEIACLSLEYDMDAATTSVAPARSFSSLPINTCGAETSSLITGIVAVSFITYWLTFFRDLTIF